ncbi:MAG: Flp pilus assembly protein CpaB [Rhodobacterales bacterium RIFCSPHIGHO2_02_FULL_62_130]|jgi:pilus assembly protein CpaB|nr:MAG: Flp pilus assembly protein CpaB [Rhodobacterales bacterium RIFCSPHIGHO2_02_FULL_62_130]OHC57190.1 MAG: Flp pilus assembly protein CpaB [Rhodobacterales bacterium RIFCSPHIGHO2_12_FULL_62_75]HCZ01332.1 Flp pilus assembly protein CpaB [Rhodobacter sp.]
MRMIFGLVLIVGIALAGAAVYMAKGYINKTEFALQEELKIKARTGGLVELFVVNKPKNYGEQLTKDDVQMIYWPKNALPEAAFFDPAVLFPEDNTAPRYVLRQMEQFEPVLAMKVTEPGEQAGLNGSIERGMRAFAIKVDAADFLQPGDHVDIYWTGAVSGNDGELTRLIETKVKIIAVDRSPKKGLSDGAIAARTMTVAATPEQVARLAQAQATGRLVMSLVGMGDDSAAGFVEVDSDALLGIEQQTAAKIEEEKVCTIRTRKGADVLEIPIPCTN